MVRPAGVWVVFTRRRLRQSSCCACAALLFAAADAAAELRDTSVPGTLAAEAAAVAASMSAQPMVRGSGAWVRAVVRTSDDRRPGGLVPMYVGFAALQALDAHSTLAGVKHGHPEANPFMAPVAHRPALLIGTKAAVAVGTIALSERLWRRHRTAAVVLMLAVNAAHAAVVAHNYRQLQR